MARLQFPPKSRIVTGKQLIILLLEITRCSLFKLYPIQVIFVHLSSLLALQLTRRLKSRLGNLEEICNRSLKGF